MKKNMWDFLSIVKLKGPNGIEKIKDDISNSRSGF